MLFSQSSTSSWKRRFVHTFTYLAIQLFQTLSSESRQLYANVNVSETESNAIKNSPSSFEPVYFGGQQNEIELSQPMLLSHFSPHNQPKYFQESSFYSLADLPPPPKSFQQPQVSKYPYLNQDVMKIPPLSQAQHVHDQYLYHNPKAQTQLRNLNSHLYQSKYPQQLEQDTSLLDHGKQIKPPQQPPRQHVQYQKQFLLPQVAKQVGGYHEPFKSSVEQIWAVQGPKSIGQFNSSKMLDPKPNYRPSILTRPMPILNQNVTVRPDKVLLSTSQAGSAGSVHKLSSVSPKEIETLLKKLSPLSQVSKSDLGDAAKEAEQSDDDDDDEPTMDKEDLEDLKREQRLQRVLPTSHLFGSLGIVNENKISGDTASSPSKHIEKSQTASGEEDDSSFIKTLAELGKKLSDKSEDDQIDKDFYMETGNDKQEPKAESVSQQTDNQSPIPIELLVDHLMSSSRMASFGVQHQGVGSDGDEGSSDDEAEEIDDEDRDNNGTLPPEARIDANESSRSETMVTPTVSFSSVLNRTDSWIPMDSMVLKSKRSSRAKKRTRSKKRIKRNKKSKNDELNLIIGGKALNRAELVRLMRVLNKMASQKEASKEREASRKLLKFLVKLAMDQYRKSKMSSQNTKTKSSIEAKAKKGKPQDDRVRDFLRSILVAPIGNGTSSVIELKPAKVGRSKQIVSEEKQDEIVKGDEDNTDNNNQEDTKMKRVPKSSLSKISDELEQYFDGDFFEDLADNSNSTPAKSSPQLRRHRAPRFSYQLPVPIYGNRYVEAADEDDVDLDHEHLPPRTMAKSRLARHREPTERFSRRKSKLMKNYKSYPGDGVHIDPSEQRLRKALRRRAPKRGDIEGKDEPDEDPDSEDNDRDEVEDKKVRTIRVKKRKKRRKEANEKSTDEKQVAADGEDAEAQNDGQQQSGGEEPEGEPEDRTDTHDQDQSYESNEPRVAGNDDKLVPSKRKTMSSKTPQKASTKTKSAKKTSSKFDRHYMRDDIPAPVEVGKFSSTSLPKSRIKMNKVAAEAKRSATNVTGSSRQESRIKKTRPTGTKVGRTYNRTKQIKSKRNSKEDESDDVDSDMVDRPPNETNDDYYNEGTSFSQICDDSGNCKTVVKSSSPVLNKAIGSQDNKAIEKQLTKWASEPD